MQPLAYRVDSDEGSIVFTSDTGVCNSVIKLAKGADTLLIHCWDHQETMKDNEAKMITGTIDAAQIAKETGANKLILAHQGPNLDKPGSKEKGIADISGIFNGEVVFAEELMTLEI